MASIDRSTSFGFVQYYNFESCENCIRGFFYLGYQASFAQVRDTLLDFTTGIRADKAQKSRNSRLKDLEDKTSTNIYCTNIPIDWTEAVCFRPKIAACG
jgi:NADPH-ferrihemoprotein reductase